MYFLAKNPQYIEKLRKEAAEIEVKVGFYRPWMHRVFSDVKRYTFKDMNSLTAESIPFTCAILNEALRLLPPVGTNFRELMTSKHFKPFFLNILSLERSSLIKSCNSS